MSGRIDGPVGSAAPQTNDIESGPSKFRWLDDTMDGWIEVLSYCLLFLARGLTFLSSKWSLLQQNAAKFVEKGFLRLRAEVDEDGMVTLFVEDSGPGVPESKQRALFKKFQASLDVLNQGTGIGLSLCKKIMALLGGEIGLDTKYNSGVEGRPGARFVISLKKQALSEDAMTKQSEDFESNEVLKGYSTKKDSSSENPTEPTMCEWNDGEANGLPSVTDLPEAISVLFVDDDPMLRKVSQIV